MKKLIVNGDDFGRTRTVTRGILEAYDHGILTSASLVANGSDLEYAAAAARDRPGLSVGIHLVLNEYPPVLRSKDIPTLIRPQGAFLSRPVILGKIMLGRANREEISREWEAQIERVLATGLELTHLDGHGHCHVCPGLGKVVLGLAERFGIGAVRLPAEPVGYRGISGRYTFQRYLEKVLLHLVCQRARGSWGAHLRFSGDFYGFMDGGCLEKDAIDLIARSLKAEVSELMTHPGIDDDDAPYGCSYHWRGDLDALLAYTKEAFEARFGIKLVSYREAWEDS